MLRSTTTAFALALALALTGCGKSTPTSSSTSLLSQVATTPTNTAPVAQGYAPNTLASSSSSTSATGSFTLSVSSLKDAKIAFVEVSLAGAGLATPVTKRLTAADLASSNTLAFEHIPVGTLTANLTALDAGGNALGAKSTSVALTANQETKLQLKLAATPAFGFDVVDPNAVAPATAPTTIDPKAAIETPISETPTSPVSEQDSGALTVAISNKAVVRKFLLFKKLAVTVKVTNQNKTQTLNGQVVVDFHKMSGLFTKTDAVVETLTAPVDSLAPGKSIEVTLQSTKAADDAEATVHTIIASASASTQQ